MRKIDVKIVKETVKKLFLNANFYLDKKIKNKIINTWQKREENV